MQRPALPVPDAAAQAASDTLVAQIRADIVRAGGWISFARYMELALYTPHLGYYAGGAAKFGAEGDFVTAPEVSSLFGRALARQVAEVLAASSPQIFEFGAGSGALAATLLAELEQLGAACERYAIVELSGALRARQRATIEAAVPHLLDKVAWLDALPARIEGCVVANEVLDAMPAHWVAWRHDTLLERGVVCGAAQFAVEERPATGTLSDAMQELATHHSLSMAPDGYVSEVNLAANAWMTSLGECLQHGAALLIDYGFNESTFYHPQRNQGTLRAHYRHYALDDPFYLPGLCDLTTHVDFTAVAVAAQNAGLAVDGYTTQAQFLINCGITELLAQSDPDDVRCHGQLTQQANTLLSPAEMGELFKVLAVSAGTRQDWRGFCRGNRLHTL